MKNNLLIIIFAAILGFVISTYINVRMPYTKTETITQIDTIVKHDTIREYVPQYINRYVVRYDTTTLYLKDSTEQEAILPVENVEYKTNEYYAIVEGFKPNLKYIETYNKTQYINSTETKIVKTNPRFGFGLQVGGGTDFKSVTPYIGVGFTYNIFTW